jgi:hypothetical protein
MPKFFWTKYHVTLRQTPSLSLVSFGDTVPYPPDCHVLFEWPLRSKKNMTTISNICQTRSQRASLGSALFVHLDLVQSFGTKKSHFCS